MPAVLLLIMFMYFGGSVLLSLPGLWYFHCPGSAVLFVTRLEFCPIGLLHNALSTSRKIELHCWDVRFRQTSRHPFNQSASFAYGGIRYTGGMARWCNGQHPRSVRESPRVRIRAEP